jgi:hypothetical protein
LSHDEILTNSFVHLKRGALEIQIVVSREVLAHTYVVILFFSPLVVHLLTTTVSNLKISVSGIGIPGTTVLL